MFKPWENEGLWPLTMARKTLLPSLGAGKEKEL